ncbi:MAG: twin-arginine translocation signal domain-containing protein [Planctomycetaceae bacterium]|nr:twin-arginine translocation signal domain-containing protein [Planctomycetaceae bacterium]
MTLEQVTRRTFLQGVGTVAALAAGCGRNAPGPTEASSIDRVIVLGVDGFDPVLLEKFVAEGRMPHCRQLMADGSFRRLETSEPPQSPVAWSNFISGTNPGGHGIFDFVARDPETMTPYHATARAEQAGTRLPIGGWQIPLSSGKLRNLRRGPTFWTSLEQRGIACTVLRVPANFPPAADETVALSGMGTPDLAGGYGTFTFFTDDPQSRTREVSGGRIVSVDVRDDMCRCTLSGPVNSFAADGRIAEIPLQIDLDPQRPLARIKVGDETFVLAEGEWSDWIPVRFGLLPHVVDVAGVCRFLLKRATPQPGRGRLALYVSPVNIDPSDPALPISNPPDYSRRLVRELGYFYTQGMAEDTKALSAGVLSASEYRQQATFVLDERMRFFEHELARFERGFFFHYFSTLDLSSHVFWRTLDRGHPLYSAELAAQEGDFIPELYDQIDLAIGRALETVDDKTLLFVISDHGFTSFRRQFNLNSWLMDNRYIRPKVSRVQSVNSYFADVDWTRTKAYGLGINGLYLNLQGREAHGTVAPGPEADKLLRELAERLTAVRDPLTGDAVIARVHLASEIYSGPYAADGPDLIVGYNNNYRASWDTILGGFPRELILDNTDAWSGDHCVDSAFVPGVLLCNRPLRRDRPALEDLAPTILEAFGVEVPVEMTGNNLL